MLTNTRLLQLIKRLIDGMGADERTVAPGVLLTGERGGIDDGDYGDPTAVDDRPDFVKADEEGWTSLPDSRKP